MLFGYRLLERRKDRLRRCLGTVCWRGGRKVLTLFGNRLLARGERIINTVLQSAAEGRGQNMTYFRNSFLERGEDLF